MRFKVGEKISTYALTFEKVQMYDLGARPAIYGLSVEPKTSRGERGGRRDLPKECLPLQEQYRYVSYVPSGSYRVDWTHEREWRWPYANTSRLEEFQQQLLDDGVVSSVCDIPGLAIYETWLSAIGVIVPTSDEAGKILHDILTVVDRKVADQNTFSYILAADRIPSAEMIRGRSEEMAALSQAAIDLESLLRPQPDRDEPIVAEIDQMIGSIEERSPSPEMGELGGCWLWFRENDHPVTRALLNQGRIEVNKSGKYLFFPHGFSDSRNLADRERMTKQLAEMVNSRFEVECGYFSVLMSDDPDGLPSYNSDFLDDRLIYNYWFDGL